MKYEIETSKKFKKQFKKLSSKNTNLVLEIIEKLSNGEVLEQKYNDHKLKGNYKDYRECHIKPDLLLIYKKKEDILILTCIDLGSHSELFRNIMIKLYYTIEALKKGDKMNITLNIPEETQEFYFEIAKERNITKEELMEEAILEYLDDYKTALTLRKARLNGETGESWQSVKKELGL